MRPIFGAGVLVAALAACSPVSREPTAPTAEETARAGVELTAYLDAEYEKELLDRPEEMTTLGRKDRYGELDDRSEAAADRRLEWRRRSVADMNARFNPRALDEDARLSYDIWALELKRAEERNRWRRHVYVFDRGNATTDLPNFMINLHRVDEKADMEAYVSRVERFDDVLDQLLVRARAAAADGIHMPRFVYDQSLDEITRVTTGAPFGPGKNSALLGDAKTKIHALLQSGKLTPAEAKEFEARVSDAMVREMKPAYDRVAAFLKEDQPNAQSADKQGALALPNPRDYYSGALFLQTTTQMTADEIHELGLAEVARIRGEMEKVKNAAAFPGTLEEFFVFMRTAKRFYLPDNDAGAAEYIKLADRYLSGMKAKLPEYFGILPSADLVVKRVEPFRERPGAAQHYVAGTPDGSRPGVFYAHLSDMNAMPTYQIENIAYHEGVPGHHMQISIQQELTGIPRFRTRYGYGAFSEGWGLYAEALAKEMGFAVDPYNDFGRLAGEIWRAIRLVVDTGIHSKGWTQKQAEDYFLGNSPQPAQAVKSEIERYILNPGQATSYKIGMITIQRLREEAMKTLGEKFDIRAFHDTVLGGGALPLPVFEGKVRRWIAGQKAQ